MIKVDSLSGGLGKGRRTKYFRTKLTTNWNYLLTCDPALKARKHASRIPPPSAARGTECPGISLMVPSLLKRPFLGRMAMQLTRAHVPPDNVNRGLITHLTAKITITSLKKLNMNDVGIR
jgi:hypothetical protein